MISIKLIKDILREQDPERLIDHACKNYDEYDSEAELIYNRIITENKKRLDEYTSAVIFVFYESIGASMNPFDPDDFGYSINYLNFEKINRFKIIGKLIFDKRFEEA